MKDYELTLILSPDIEETQVNDTVQELISFIQDEGGILYDQNILGKKPLLAPVKNHKEAYLGLLVFNIQPEKLSVLEKKCKETEQILRFLLLVRPAKKIAKTPKSSRILNTIQKISPDLQGPESEGETTIDKKKEEKIELKDIDEKLKEIFKEE